MTEAQTLLATLLRGLRSARRIEAVGGMNRYGFGSVDSYRRNLVRYRAMRANGTLDLFFFQSEGVDTPLVFG